jgi:hypothetical protein
MLSSPFFVSRMAHSVPEEVKSILHGATCSRCKNQILMVKCSKCTDAVVGIVASYEARRTKYEREGQQISDEMCRQYLLQMSRAFHDEIHGTDDDKATDETQTRHRHSCLVCDKIHSDEEFSPRSFGDTPGSDTSYEGPPIRHRRPAEARNYSDEALSTYFECFFRGTSEAGTAP